MKKKFLILLLTTLGGYVFSQSSDERHPPSFSKGDVVCSSNASLFGDRELSLSNMPYDENMVAIYSGSQTIMIKQLYISEGITEVKFDHSNGEVEKGDYITSGLNGKSIKATQTGFVLGIALENSQGKELIKTRVLIQYVKQ
jgi:hypothetical protein